MCITGRPCHSTGDPSGANDDGHSNPHSTMAEGCQRFKFCLTGSGLPLPHRRTLSRVEASLHSSFLLSTAATACTAIILATLGSWAPAYLHACVPVFVEHNDVMRSSKSSSFQLRISIPLPQVTAKLRAGFPHQALLRTLRN